MFNFEEEIKGMSSIAISGHVRPDGDCVGSTMAVYNYLLTYHPEIHVEIFLDFIPRIFTFFANTADIQEERPEGKTFDLFIACDCGDLDRLGPSAKYFTSAKKTICIDHHVSNQAFADVNYIVPEASSTCELVYNLFGDEKITKEIAECIYTGMVHDTGVFQYSCTSRKTMMVAGALMEKGIAYSEIIDATFYTKSFEQNRILGKALNDAFLTLDGRMIVSVISAKDMEEYHVTTRHLDGIVNQLRVTKGVCVALFMYETEELGYKVSLRCNGDIDLAKIAMVFGGGGHKKAAGISFEGYKPEEIIEKISEEVVKQLDV